MGSTTIHPFPELVALAEEEARAHFESLRDVARSMPGTLPKLAAGGGWEMPAPSLRRAWISAHLALLCDLTRPASRDAVARLVAKRIGWHPGRVIMAMEASGEMRFRLYRAAGVAGLCSSAAAALALVVDGLWPPEAPRG